MAVTNFQRSTIAQIKSNLNSPEKYKMIVILDDDFFDGFEAAGALSENNFSSEFIILMISANDKKGNYTRCVTLGIDEYLVKPFDMSELTFVIQRCFPYVGKGITTEESDSIRRDIRILIVDDNKMNQLVLGAMLKNLGYCFDLASDGYEGYLAAKDVRYDIIFMDLLMPEMDGYQAAQKILAADKKALIVAFSANNMPESRKKAEMFGIKEFISKPVSLEDLKKLLSKYFLKA
jgi:CheY-like chemotaxis protein